jgi:hypothetical protein
METIASMGHSGMHKPQSMQVSGSNAQSLLPARNGQRANRWLITAYLLLGVLYRGEAAAPPGELSAPSPEVVRAARLYRVVPDRSELRLLVYRSGALAMFGHNHVISSQAIDGSVYVGESPESSFFMLKLPVQDFEVDRPELRNEEGDDFSSSMDEKAIQGTRKNMLGESMMDAANYPEIHLASRHISGALPKLLLTVDVQIRDQVSQLQVPVEVVINMGHLTATGSFSFDQTAVGLKPFRAMLGALRVRDTVDVKFSITATRAPPAP